MIPPDTTVINAKQAVNAGGGANQKTNNVASATMEKGQRTLHLCVKGQTNETQRRASYNTLISCCTAASPNQQIGKTT